MFVVVRSSVPAAEIVPSLRRQVQALYPGIPLTDVTTTSQLLSDSMAAPRYRTLVLGTFGFMAMVLENVSEPTLLMLPETPGTGR